MIAIRTTTDTNPHTVDIVQVICLGKSVNLVTAVPKHHGISDGFFRCSPQEVVLTPDAWETTMKPKLIECVGGQQ